MAKNASYMPSPPILDRKFLGAAVGIGLVYSVIVVGLQALIGPQAAGVAGVSLTALATAIFKQFETLRFREISEEDAIEVKVPRVFSWPIVSVILMFMGMDVIRYRIWNELALLRFDEYWLFGLLFLGSYLVSGFVVKMATPYPGYSHVVIGATLSLFMTILWTLLDLDLGIVGVFTSELTLPYVPIWLLLPLSALAGAYFADRKKRR